MVKKIEPNKIAKFIIIILISNNTFYQQLKTVVNSFRYIGSYDSCVSATSFSFVIIYSYLEVFQVEL